MKTKWIYIVVLPLILTIVTFARATELPIGLPRTGQVFSLDANTPQRDDGAIRAGVAWPDPRFTDNGDETVKDNLTGLEWTKDANNPGPSACRSLPIYQLQEALDYVACLNTNSFLGHTDWRLPNVLELRSLVDFSQSPALPAGHPFKFVQKYGRYFSSTGVKTGVKTVYMLNGSLSSGGRFAWPVRGGQCGVDASVICLPRTGQTISYAPGDDGDLKMGVAWPEHRWTYNPNLTKTDNLTGLNWGGSAVKNAPEACTKGGSSWQGVLDYVACLNTNSFLGHTDWRMPNVVELQSVLDWSGSGCSSNLGVYVFWSSTNVVGWLGGGGAFSINVENCSPEDADISQQGLTIAASGKGRGIVRGGQVDNSVSCVFSIPYASENFIYSGASDTLSVTASQNNCEWTATSNVSWVTITSGQSGTGNGAVTFTVSANNETGQRTGTLTIAEKTFTVTQLNDIPINGIISIPKTGPGSYGVAWPNPRFTDNGDQAVKDNLTGLEWTKDPLAPGPTACGPGTKKNWLGALDYVACLNTNSFLGHTDWRLPNANEFSSLADLSGNNHADMKLTHPVEDMVTSSFKPTYSTRYIPNSPDLFYPWPVRGGQCGVDASVICLPRTGQTISYAPGDDGDLKMGVAWPEHRFIYNGDGTVTDILTGLTWTRETNAPGPTACWGGRKTWQGAVDYVACLNTNSFLGHTDWRMPNLFELRSLIDISKSQPGFPTDYLFTISGTVITLGQMADYWSSSPTVGWSLPGMWYVEFYNVSQFALHLYDAAYAWPVRGGQSGPLNNSGISISPNTKDFGNVKVGETAPAQIFTISNTGTASLVISSIGLIDGNSGMFSVATATCTSLTPTLASGSSCTISATFSPTVAGAKSATLRITSNDSNTANSDISLIGMGVEQTCSYSISPSNKSFTYKGSTQRVRVRASGTTCIWTASSDSTDWMTITFGGSSKTIRYTVTANTSATSRTGHITIGDKTFTVTQAGKPCGYSISPTSSKPAISKAGGTGSITVTPTPSDCSWTAEVDTKAKSWVTVTDGNSGTGTGTVSFSASASGIKRARTGKIKIVGSDSKVKKSFIVKQSKQKNY